MTDTAKIELPLPPEGTWEDRTPEFRARVMAYESCFDARELAVLAVVREDQFLSSLERISELEQQLKAMAEDRDLWQGEHNEDCPNLAALQEAEQQQVKLKELLEEIQDEAYDRVDIDDEGRPNWAMRVYDRIKAAVTGE